jgi:hypothetical protein
MGIMDLLNGARSLESCGSNEHVRALKAAAPGVSETL